MDNSNIRLLSVYYSTEKFLKNNLASPLMSAVRPIIGVQEHSYSLIVERAMPNLTQTVSKKKLHALLQKKFSKIESGEIQAFDLLGSELSADEIVEQAKVHDTFTVLYKLFFKKLAVVRNEHAAHVHMQVRQALEELNQQMSVLEMKILRDAFTGVKSRTPLSLDIDLLIEIINIIHEVTARRCGVTIADQVLSNAIMQTEQKVSAFKARNFL